MTAERGRHGEPHERGAAESQATDVTLPAGADSSLAETHEALTAKGRAALAAGTLETLAAGAREGISAPADTGARRPPLGVREAGPQGTVIVPVTVTSALGAGARPFAVIRIGERVGGEDGCRFELLERIGAGGMAVVFLAKDTLLDRTVAIKFITHELLGSSAIESVERFKQEARASARLSHENIVRVFDLGTANGVPFLVMEYLDGAPLDVLAKREEIDALRAVRIIADVARGMAHAHRAGIVHRDLKPGNVFLLQDGRAKIVDFGLASMAAGLDAQSPAIAGTPRYMSPEQWKGGAQDGRTDIWAAGVMLFELLAGQPPFAGERLHDLRKAVLSPEPSPSIRAFRPDLPEDAERLLARALQKDVGERFGTAEELLYALVGLEVALGRSMRAASHESIEGKIERHPAERRQITLLSCALSDILVLAEELELDDFSELLDGFFEVCNTVVRQLEGTILTSLGGSVMACFGYPVAHEDDAQRAVRCAFLIADSIRSLTRLDGTPHGVRTGVHTGFTITTEAPAGRDRQAMIQGEAPHLAAWLERAAGPHEILLGPRTQQLVRGLFEVEPLGPRTPEGAPRPMEVFRALRPTAAASRFERISTSQLTPLVGRERELDEIRAQWRRAREGEGQLVVISGEPGIGKSRLLEMFKDQIAASPHNRIGCQCWPHFRSSALYPVLDGMLRAIGVRPEHAAAEKIQRIEASLSGLGLPLAEHLPLVATFLSLPLPDRYAPPALSPDLLKNRLLETLCTTLLRLAAQQPTLFVVEDAHWSDASTLEFLDLLIPRIQNAGLMVLVTLRPELKPPWSERSNQHRVALARLSSSQTAAMVAFASQGRNLPAEIVEHLIRRTDGIPLFVEELTRMVADAWQAAEEEGQAVSARSFAAKTIPPTLHELLLARLDRLSEAGKVAAQVASVIGREVPFSLLCRVAPVDEATLRGGLMQLVEAGVLRHDGRAGDGDARYTFRHALLQEAAYQSLVKPKRREHHERAAAAIVAHFPEIALQNPELVGHHYAEAGDAEQAIAYLEKAGRRAVERSAGADAVTHFTRAIALLDALPETPERDRRELSLQLALGAPLMGTKGYAAPEVHACYARARELCRRQGDDAQLFPAVLGLWQFYMVGGEAEVSADLGRQLLAQAERSGDATMRMLAHRGLGTSLMLLGEIDACRHHCETGLSLYDRAAHGKLALRYGQDPGVTNGLYLAWVLWFLGYPDQALARGREALALAEAIEHPLSIAFAMNYLATVHNYRGEYAAAKGLAERAMVISTDHKLALWLAMCKIQRGWALLGEGDRGPGADQLKEGVQGWTKTGAKAGLTFFLAALIWGLWQAGRLDEAEATVREMEAFIEQKGERFFEAELLRLRGEITLSRDPSATAAAESCFRRGLAIARARKARAWELRLAMSLARLLSRTARSAEAREHLAPARAWFTEGLATADLREAAALLAGL